MTIFSSQNLFYTHAWETYLIGGLLIFLCGLFLGRLLWRGQRARSERIEQRNETLRKSLATLESTNRDLAKLIAELPESKKS